MNKKSKCWTCQHGICVKESQVEKFLQPKDGHEQQFLDMDGNMEQQQDIIDITHTMVRAVCFWRPSGVENSPPMLFSEVEECSRYKANQ